MPLPRPRLGKLPPRSAAFLLPLILSVVMTCVVSGVATLRALGPTAEAMRAWPAAWALSWPVAFPTLLLALPVVRRVVSLLVAPPPAR
ncbi:DUF2798 domain-containing protein [Paracraurococcus lichenis]|uniref:DUF2798 domain-containing protein n=1 Tax=Paracraurococcus lichenis TaxID=3064888 RepID=A0ABT9E155_9PROT|nr:DUF2798 domain-containing protein [Paracraurococcus sp. LOR1-02]MDO9709900.1 DUF2798 domain-containing protein [Paracraurococcus sp. LOR1-02]